MVSKFHAWIRFGSSQDSQARKNTIHISKFCKGFGIWSSQVFTLLCVKVSGSPGVQVTQLPNAAQKFIDPPAGEGCVTPPRSLNAMSVWPFIPAPQTSRHRHQVTWNCIYCIYCIYFTAGNNQIRSASNPFLRLWWDGCLHHLAPWDTSCFAVKRYPSKTSTSISFRRITTTLEDIELLFKSRYHWWFNPFHTLFGHGNQSSQVWLKSNKH